MKPSQSSSRTIALTAIMVICVMAAQAKADALAADQSFYTGKPYLPATGSYAFKYRSYQPELARWTSEDPSGFPDGANANIYAPTPTSEFDWMGLARVSFDSNKYTNATYGISCSAFGFFEYSLSGDGFSFEKYEGGWESGLNGTSANTKDDNNSLTVTLGIFRKDQGTDEGTTPDGIRWTQEWIDVYAQFDISSKIKGLTSGSTFTAAQLGKQTASKKYYE
jgi:RHS repeat-associated protein